MLVHFRISATVLVTAFLLCGVSSKSGLADAAAQEASVSLWKEYEAASRPIWQQMLETMPEEELRQRFWSEAPLDPLGAEFGKKFIALAAAYPGTPAGLLSLKQVITGRGFADPDREVACDKVVEGYLETDLLRSDIYFWLYRPETAYVDHFFRKIIASGKAPRELDGMARFSLAYWLVAFNKRQDVTPAREKDASALLAEVARDYADLPHPFDADRGTLGDAAQRLLFELDRLGIGDEAPEIVGEDVFGATLKLSDYRGQVLMLVFCGEWCAPCRALYPYEKELIASHEGRPFSIVGVNTDPKETLRSAIDREDFTWRRWWDGGSTRGPIVTEWNVGSFPTIFVLDHRGIIRAKYCGITEAGRDELASQIEALLKAAEDARSTRDSESDAE